MKKITLFYIFITLITGCFQSDRDKQAPDEQEEIKRIEKLQTDINGLSKSKAIIKTVHGNITFKFYPKEAPHSVTRIIELINKGFYDGLLFHRVEPGFVVQTGDPTNTGTGGSGQKLKAEFSQIQHIKGTVALARAEDKNSADSQFYIALTTLSHLDNNYTIIGQVIEGLEYLDKIKRNDKILSLSFLD